jgi:hypothetical protein
MRLSRVYLSLLILPASACTGLMAGPESTSVTAVPASRDSAYVRARRGLTGESFTLEKADSAGGVLVATRWPSSSARLGTAGACHVSVAMKINGTQERSEVSTTSRWIAPGAMADEAAKVCDKERTEVLERTAQVLVPPPTQ